VDNAADDEGTLDSTAVGPPRPGGNAAPRPRPAGAGGIAARLGGGGTPAAPPPRPGGPGGAPI
jgi:hypothetical protein